MLVSQVYCEWCHELIDPSEPHIKLKDVTKAQGTQYKEYHTRCYQKSQS